MVRLLFIGLLFVPLLLAAQVTIDPAYPQRGERVKILFRQAGLAAGTKPTLVFTYTNLYELPLKIVLQPGENAAEWNTSFVLPRYATFATFYIQAGEKRITPDSGGNFELAVYDAQRKPVKNGYLYKAYSLSAQRGRTPDLAAEQASLYRRELAAYPDNYEARVRLYQYTIDHGGPAERDRARMQAHELIAARFASAPGDMNNLNSVTMAYLILGEGSRVDSIRKIVVDRYPHSTAGKELLTGIIAKEKDTAVMVRRFEEELKEETAADRNVYLGMHEQLFRYYAAKRNAAKALPHARAMVAVRSPYLPQTLLDVTRTLVDNELAPDTALYYAGLSRAAADSTPAGLIRYWPETGYIPAYVPDSVRLAAVSRAMAKVLALESFIYIAKADQASAVAAADSAMRLAADDETLLRVASAYEKLRLYGKAFGVRRRWSLQAAGTDTSKLTQLKDDYLRWKGSAAGWAEVYAALLGEKKAVLITALEHERLNVKAPSLDSIVDLSGNAVDPASLKGKVVVIDFWATWCGPCMEEMPYLQKVYDKYRNDPRVVFMVINSGARNTLADAKGWFGNKKYSFPVYFHTNPAVGEHFGFTVIPAVYVIDGSGKLQFKTIGFEGALMEDKLAGEIELSFGE